jgi:hypothetical protein
MMKRCLFALLLSIFSFKLFADDMTLTGRYIPDKSGITAGIMPKNMPDERGYKGSETTITPLFFSGRYIKDNLQFSLIFPIIINPDSSTDDIMLNTIVIDGGYIFDLTSIRLMAGLQFTPALNIGSNKENELNNNLSLYLCSHSEIIQYLSFDLSIQYYQSLSDKSRYSGLYITRANSGFSIESRIEYLFEQERISVLTESLLFRDLSNGISNIYLNPGVRFIVDDFNTVYVTLSIPLYDDKFTERYGSGLNLYYDRKF